MPLRHMQYSFAGGELSPQMFGRVDVNRYFASAAVCLNYVTTPQGSVVRRDGTLFVAAAKYANRAARLERFEFSITQAYVLEIGHEYVRFFRDLGRLENPPGTPVEVATPYQEADLFDLQMVQSADVLSLAHPDYPPAKLLRLSETSWEYQVIQFRPPPSVEVNTDLGTTLTPGATSGIGVTCTAGAAVFLDGDVDRQLVSGSARAVITALGSASPSATITVTILSPFASTSAIAAGDWFVTGSPAVSLHPDKTGPVGALVTLNAERELTTAAELCTNGGFDSDSDWTDLSAPVLATGTTTSGSDVLLEDSGATFETDGVEVAHIAETASATTDRIEAVVSETELTTAAGGVNWGTPTDYTIHETGSAVIVGGECRLDGGENGVAWREQGIPTVIGVSYRVQFDVRAFPLSVLVGETSGASDVVAEATYQVGNAQAFTFVASTTTSYVGFRNTQDQQAVLDNVSVKSISAQAFRAADVGKFLTVAEGVVEITRVVSASQVEGIAWAALSLDLDANEVALAGAWTLGVAAWSASQGFPRALSFHQGRLWYFGTAQHPLTGWGSVVNDYENFAVGAADDDAVMVELSANAMNVIEWAEPFRDLFVGTRGGEHLLTGGANPITPSNLAQSPQDTAGSPPFRPIRVGNVLFHLQRGRRKVRELTVDADTGLTRVRDATLLAEHITQGGIVQWAIQRQPVERLWAIRADGQLLGFTFEVLEETRGWHHHTCPLGAWESVATVPVDEGSAETERVWLLARRTINGATTRTIEVMRPLMETATTRRVGLTMDSVLSYDGVPATTFSGLDHLEGAPVHLVAREDATMTLLDGTTRTVDALTHLGSQVVTGGQVTTDVAVSRLDVGLHGDSLLVTLPLELTLQDGPMQGRKIRIVATTLRVLDTLGLEVNGQPVSWRTVDDLFDTGQAPQETDIRLPGGPWAQAAGARVQVRQTLPLPSTVLGLINEVQVEDAD